MAEDTPIRMAATTLLVRERGGLEVLMVKRNQQIDFFSGAMVFPGGKVEKNDENPAWASLADGFAATPEPERGPRIAALREAFEECGVLAVDGVLPAHAQRLHNARAEVEAGRLGFADLVRELGLRLDLSRLTLFARWLTPSIMPKRFDTFFYLVPMPEGQVVAHDGRETVDNEWVRPEQALALAKSGARTILFPTRMNLQRLAETRSLAEAVAAAEKRPSRQVMPIVEMREGQRYLRLDAEDGYGEVEELLKTG